MCCCRKFWHALGLVECLVSRVRDSLTLPSPGSREGIAHPTATRLPSWICTQSNPSSLFTIIIIIFHTRTPTLSFHGKRFVLFCFNIVKILYSLRNCLTHFIEKYRHEKSVFMICIRNSRVFDVLETKEHHTKIDYYRIYLKHKSFIYEIIKKTILFLIILPNHYKNSMTTKKSIAMWTVTSEKLR